MRINNIKILVIIIKKNKNKKISWLVSQVQIRSTTI